MRPKAALVLLTVASPVLLGILMFGGPAVAWLAVPLITGLPLLFIAIGSGRHAPSGRSLLAIWILLCGSWTSLFWLSSRVDLDQPTPESASLVLALMLLGLGLVPLVLIGWIFMRSFRIEGLGPEDLARLPRERGP